MSSSYNSDKEFITLMFPDEEECKKVENVIELLRENLYSNPDDKGIRFQLAAAYVSHSSWMFIREGVEILLNLTQEWIADQINCWKGNKLEIEEVESTNSNSNNIAHINDACQNMNSDENVILNNDCKITDVSMICKASDALKEEHVATTRLEQTQSSTSMVSTERVTSLLLEGVCISKASAPPPEQADEQESSVKKTRKNDSCSSRQREESTEQVNRPQEPEQLQRLENTRQSLELTSDTTDLNSQNTELSDWNRYSELNVSNGTIQDKVSAGTRDERESGEGENNISNIINCNNNNNKNNNNNNCDELLNTNNQLQTNENDCVIITNNNREGNSNSSSSSSSDSPKSEWIELISTRGKMSNNHTPSPSLLSVNNESLTREERELQSDKEVTAEKISEMERCLISNDDSIDTIAPKEMSDLAFYYYYLTVGYSKLNEKESARVYLEEALKLSPESVKVLTLKEYICGKEKPISKSESEKDATHTTKAKSEPKEYEQSEQKQCDSNFDKQKNTGSNNEGFIAGGIIGAVVIVLAILFFRRYKKTKSPTN